MRRAYGGVMPACAGEPKATDTKAAPGAGFPETKEALGSRESLAKSGIPTYSSPFGCKGGGGGTAVGVSFESVWTDITGVAEASGVPECAAAIKKEQKARLTRLSADRAGDGLTMFWLDMVGKCASVGAADKEKFLAADPVLRQLDAVKNKRYVTIPFVEGTPGARLVDGVERVSKALKSLDVG